MTQKDLALKTGMRQPDISRIEEGKKNITLKVLNRLCEVLDIRRIDLSD
jgi:transcriptional regulator with XRE-family HTH domain